MQRELRGFADGAAEYQYARGRKPSAREPAVGNPLKHLGEIHRAERSEDDHDAGEHADIADAIDDERYFAGIGGQVFFKPMANQKVGTDADELPKNVNAEKAINQHQTEHGKREQREIGKIAAVAHVVMKVADRIEVHQRAHQGHNEEHDRGEIVDEYAKGN